MEKFYNLRIGSVSLLFSIIIENGMLQVTCNRIKKLSEYDQEIPQSHTADQPWHHEEEPQII